MIAEVREGKTIATTKHELICLIKDRINHQGNACSLNDIDVSRIKDMSFLFWDFRDFNGDISEWDVSNVRDMSYMFRHSKFNGDVSKWDVSSVFFMKEMFALSYFSGDLRQWCDKMNPECDCTFMLWSTYTRTH